MRESSDFDENQEQPFKDPNKTRMPSSSISRTFPVRELSLNNDNGLL